MSRFDDPENEKVSARQALTPYDMLVKSLANLERIPPQLPSAPAIAAQKFLDILEPPRESAGAYLARVRAAFGAFMRADDRLRDLVMDAAVDNIRWRGEDYQQFLGVIGETLRMREIGPAAYRKEAIGKIKAGLAKIGGGNG